MLAMLFSVCFLVHLLVSLSSLPYSCLLIILFAIFENIIVT